MADVTAGHGERSGDRPLEGQWAVVTGGSKGIGQAIGRRLIAGGAHVVLVARGQDDLDAAVSSARRDVPSGQQVLGLVADMANRDSIEAVFASVADRTPSLNIFVANAGTGRVTPFLELGRDEFDAIVALNFTGAVFGCQQAARMMVATPVENQVIVAVSSVRALGARPGRLVYAATKAALNQAVRVAAVELAPFGIRVCALSPGITETPLTAANKEVFDEVVRGVPLGRAGLPLDLAEAAYFLCSPQAAFITGANLVVDGGESVL
ncbi:MAG: SDR family NAD(P)-dependent oxidoreductase [Acidimicrobiia bacterium]